MPFQPEMNYERRLMTSLSGVCRYRDAKITNVRLSAHFSPSKTAMNYVDLELLTLQRRGGWNNLGTSITQNNENIPESLDQ